MGGVSAPANGNGVLAATEPVVRVLLDEARKKRYRAGVIGIRAKPTWDGPERFTHDGRPVIVAPCESTLAVWEALRQRDSNSWLVILTPRDDDDLGTGVISHFIGNRVRTPDPWQAVGQRFEAARLDPALYDRENGRAVALGLLAAMPADGWPPAPGGVLTLSHALHSVARGHLQMVERGMEIDARAVLEWSTRPDATTLLAELRAVAGDALTDVLIDWVASRSGRIERPARTLLRAGRVSDLVPLGLIAGLLTDDDSDVIRAAGTFQGKFGFGQLSKDVLAAWHADAADLTTQVLDRERSRRITDTATIRLRELDLAQFAERSEILAAGLAARIGDLAKGIDGVVPATTTSDLDAPLVTATLAAVEDASASAQAHHLAADDRTVMALRAALRLVRWLASDVHTGSSLSDLMRRHVDSDAWVDSAVNDVMRGSALPAIAEVLGTVLDLVQRRRDHHDLAFAQALAAVEEPDELCVERLLPEQVVPLARKQPVLLLVIDALSVGVATELVAAASGWVEYALPGRAARAGALAALPTLTQCSRCSLLSGELRRGAADDERKGFAQLLKRERLGNGRDIPLFHQKELDTVRAGLALAPAVQNAIADTADRPLVAAVLNIVDDTLHHTDPAGADWNLDTITHLRALLEAARRAGRIVVITSDHGHVIERRNGSFRKYPATHGNRARATTPPAEPDEVLVQGPRVFTDTQTAILAVNERLRYGPINAGYHGGASAAEAVVPVIVLHAGDAPVTADLTPLGRVEPQWWTPAFSAQPVRPGSEPPVLFELPEPAAAETAEAAKLAKQVVTSKAFQQQKVIAGRLTIADDHIRALLGALLAAPGGRIPAEEAADALGIATVRLRGALPMLKRVLDVEGYVVISYEAESGQVVLDEPMLREQFGLKR